MTKVMLKIVLVWWGEEWTMFTDKADPLRRHRAVTLI
jgi:hypothetical protein